MLYLKESLKIRLFFRIPELKEQQRNFKRTVVGKTTYPLNLNKKFKNFHKQKFEKIAGQSFLNLLVF
jgi:hypothetical protein